MNKKIKWTLWVIGALSSIVLIFFIIFTFESDSGNDDIANQNELEESIQTEELTDILILGDSIGSGVGDEEKSGMGERFVSLLELEAEPEEVITNISVPGYVNSQLVNMLDN